MPAASSGVGAITDVPGIAVGHHQRTGRGWRTGTTVVLAPDGATPGVDVRGGGPGTRETDALDPRNMVDRVHAVCLSGGSAYGLAAADGVMEVLAARGLGVAVGADPHHVVPVVPSAVIFDLGRGGRFEHRPDREFGRRATERARPRTPARGAVGAGTGAQAGFLQGGVGTASIVVGGDLGDVVVGALAVVNASGTLIDGATGLPWESAHLALRRPSRDERRALADATQPPPPLNTTIGVVATSARLTKAEASKLASVAHDGMARAIRPSHSLFDGDTVFALATGQHELRHEDVRYRLPTSRASLINAILQAAATCFERACTDAIVSATSIGGPPAYRDLCPTAFGRR